MGHFMARIAVRLSGDYGCTMTRVIIGLERHFVTWMICPLCMCTDKTIHFITSFKQIMIIPFVK